MQDRYQERRERLRRAVSKAGAEALLVTDFTNVTYLTGFTGDDSYLLVRADGEVVISDPRYTTQLEEQCPGVDLHIRPPGVTMLQAVTKVLRRAQLERLGIEADSMTVGLQDRISTECPKLEMVTTSGLVERLAADQRQGRDRPDPRGGPVCREGVRRDPGVPAVRSRPKSRWPTPWRTRCGPSGPRAVRSRASSPSGTGPPCRTPRRGRGRSDRRSWCCSIGGPTAGSTRAT